MHLFSELIDDIDESLCDYVCVLDSLVTFNKISHDRALDLLNEYKKDPKKLDQRHICSIIRELSEKEKELKPEIELEPKIIKKFKEQTLNQSLKNVHDWKSVLILPNGGHSLLVYKVSFNSDEGYTASIKNPCTKSISSFNAKALFDECISRSKNYIEVMKKN